MDHPSPMFNETAYSLAVERLLGITDQITERATTIRVLMMELNRIASHLVWLATTGVKGVISTTLYGFASASTSWTSSRRPRACG